MRVCWNEHDASSPSGIGTGTGTGTGIGIGIGEISASAPTAGVGDFKQFSGGQELSARMDLVPGQNPSGGKTVLEESPSGASHENRQPRQPDIDLAAATRGPRARVRQLIA